MNSDHFVKVFDILDSGFRDWIYPAYGLVFVPFAAFLEFIAIQSLFLPYLRTFFCIKTTPVSGCAIPSNFEPDRKIKLRDSLIYWDPEDQAIWLRPRGWNLIQIPLTVAKLKLGADEGAIGAVEMRFSSGSPFLLALLLLTAYQFVSRMPADGNGPPPAVLLGFGAFAIAALFLNFWIVRSRMERLLQAALSEIREMT